MNVRHTALVALITCSSACSKKDKPEPAKQDPATSAAVVRKATSAVSVAATFDDSRVHAMKVSFNSGRAKRIGSLIGVQLSDQPLGCGDTRPPNAMVLNVELPTLPAGIVAPIEYGTIITQSGKLEHATLATSNEAQLALTAYSTEVGGRVAGSVEFHHVEKEEGKSVSYEGKGTFDLVVCPDEVDSDLLTVSAKEFDHAKVEGTVGGSAFMGKSALARRDLFNREILVISLYDEVVTCETRREVEEKLKSRWIGAAFAVSAQGRARKGTLQPVMVESLEPGHGRQYTFAVPTRGWVRLDQLESPLGKTVGGALVIGSSQSVSKAERIDVGGKFSAVVCAD